MKDCNKRGLFYFICILIFFSALFTTHLLCLCIPLSNCPWRARQNSMMTHHIIHQVTLDLGSI